MATALVSLLIAGRPATARAAAPHRLGGSLETLVFESFVNSSLLLTGAYLLDPPDACRWCATNEFDRAARDALVASDRLTARRWSDLLLSGVSPLVALAAVTVPALADEPRRFDDALENAAIVGNAVVLTLAFVQFTKVSAARERPGVHYGTAPDIAEGDRYVSFFSGHTAMTASLAASSATVAFLRGYDTAPWIAGGGGLIAVTTGLLRMASDRHWASDVLTGFAVGTAIGVGFPLLFHPRVDGDEDGARGGLPVSLGVVPPAGREPGWLVVTGSW